MHIYIVNGAHSFAHYGKALAFAGQIGGTIRIKKTFNPFVYIAAAI